MWPWLCGGLGVLVAIGLVALAVQRNGQAAGAGQPAGAATGGGPPAAQVGGPAGAAVGEPSPTIAWPTLGGGVFRLPAGQPAVVYFMAAWCESCQPEAQALGQLQRQLGDRVAILVVDVDPVDLPSQTRAFFHTAGDPGYAIARDQNGRLAGAFAVRALDTTVVIDASGRVVYRDEVPTKLATLTRALGKAGLA